MAKYDFNSNITKINSINALIEKIINFIQYSIELMKYDVGDLSFLSTSSSICQLGIINMHYAYHIQGALRVNV